MSPDNERFILDFEENCKKAYGGLILTGKKRHCCPDWDYLPIDETCEEFKACTCQEETL